MTTIRQIEQAVAQHFGIPAAILRGSSRERRYARPRQVAMYMAREMTARSYPEIGRHFSRDHSTVIHGCRRVARIAAEDEDFRRDVESVGQRIAGTPCWRADLKAECLAAQAVAEALRGAIRYAEPVQTETR
jgi:chromosomal replication initiator protein